MEVLSKQMIVSQKSEMRKKKKKTMSLIRKCFSKIIDLLFYSVGFLICHLWNSWAMFLKVCIRIICITITLGIWLKCRFLGPIQELLGISGARRSWNLYIKALQWEWWASCTQNVHAEYQISETLPFLSYRKVKEQKRNSAFPMSHFIYREKEFKYGLGTTQSLQEHIIIGMVGMLLSWEGESCQ